MPTQTHIVCIDPSVTALNNSNLTTGVNNMVTNWNASLSGSGMSFETGTSNCSVWVKAGITNGDGKWDSNTNTATINSTTAGSWGPNQATAALTHELGHGLGLEDVDCTTGTCSSTSTVMCSPVVDTGTAACGPAECDNTVADSQYPPPDDPLGDPGGGGSCECPCGEVCDELGQCPEIVEGEGPCTPIILAVGLGSTYRLTSPESGVWFDLDADGDLDHISWTPPGEPIAFLALDWNGNGTIDNGSELFGNFTFLPGADKPRDGFNALKYYDQPENGGNLDSRIDQQDSVWSELLLWIDANHNAVSEPSELFRPGDFEVTEFSLETTTENRRDQYGNLFRLKARCRKGQTERWAYDVFFHAKPRRSPR